MDKGTAFAPAPLASFAASPAHANPSLNIPKEHTPLISRVAPLSRAAREAQDAALARQKAQWGPRKQTLRAIRDKRRTFW